MKWTNISESKHFSFVWISIIFFSPFLTDLGFGIKIRIFRQWIIKMRANYKMNKCQDQDLLRVFLFWHAQSTIRFSIVEAVRRPTYHNRKYSNAGKDCDQCFAWPMCPLSMRKALLWNAFKINLYQFRKKYCHRSNKDLLV